ncbi:PAS domain-containing sensor histidine kinase [Rhizobium tubonense]|uniref:histidine kinase n=1 Tax=Rhizobium tubonense TaxID=484088 RepID=A0A2W4E3D0_9HYPH|nr:PAS domain-containing sensor histidine kinase [Rhizobium tubonense]PZM10176.1 PAS domain-containing sensor histidine kinase [Rhizobium tubonense]
MSKPPTTPTEDLEDLYENAPCGYLSLQPDGRIVKVNKTLAIWLGVPAEQLLGKRLRDLLNMAGRIFYETHFAPLLRMQGYFNEVALDLMTADGDKLAVLANATERRDDSGNLVFTRVTLFQATERRRYERGLVDARTASDAAGAVLKSDAVLREQFIAVLGHDLRNPLASINSAARMLRKEPLSDTSIRILHLMQGSVFRMSALIDNILDFARGRLGDGLSLDRNSSEPLTPVLQQVVEELRSSHPDRNIETDFTIDDPVDCDRGRIGQLLSNLLGNAITYGKQDEPVQVSATTGGGVFQLYVANGGAPIPSEAIASLFKPFFRGDVRASQNGLGLGLHIASEIARAHGGELTVTSNIDETRFTFTLSLS